MGSLGYPPGRRGASNRPAFRGLNDAAVRPGADRTKGSSMSRMRRLLAYGLGAIYGIAFLTGVGCGGPPPEHEARGAQLFESPQADPIVLSPDGAKLYAVLTTDGRVRVIDTASMTLMRVIDVGTDPLSLTLRPDGSELWVANHVSDSVSVISLAPGPSQYTVVETVQAVDALNLITDFDEPVGIAFANNSKAYVALSSRNQIAVVDADTYQVTGLLAINAQEPRAIRVRNGFLFVPVFESGNSSELSSCVGAAPAPPPPGQPDNRQCTFDFTQADFAQNPQLVGFQVDIRKDPLVPDRDLFVFDTATDSQVSIVSGIGTLLYGVAVSSASKVFIAQTNARNAVNGHAGTEGQGLADLQDRTFLNQIGVVDCSGGTCDAPSVFQLEPLPPTQPAQGRQLATPYGIEISADNNVLVATAAASSRVFTVNANTGAMRDILDVGNGPRGIALRSDPSSGVPVTAYVLNTLDDSISKIDVRNPDDISETNRFTLNGDTTPTAIRLGRIAFNSAAGSTTGTFACGSCHPDGHVDQLLWVIGAQCNFSGCDQEGARLTMPVRGLEGTLPLHWDGTLGDPFASINGASGTNGPNVPANCTTDQTCFRQLVNASLAGVMCNQAGCPANDVGQPGGLSNVERDNMATYLQGIQYPTAPSRRFDDHLTAQAVDGFSDFFENHGGINPPVPSGGGPQTCGDAAPGSGCHALPFGTGSASRFVGGFEAPTMRGITDRFVQFSAGVTAVRDVLQAVTAISGTEVPWNPANGFDELTTWAVPFGSPTNVIAFRQVYNVRAFNVFQMIEEMSNGQSGALGRQVTLNLRSTTGSAATATGAVLSALETADLDGLVNLAGSGTRNGASVRLSFRSDGTYQGGGLVLTHAQLMAEAAQGKTVVTLTASQRAGVNAATVQPTIWVDAVGDFFLDGRPNLPIVASGNPAPFTLNAGNIQANAKVYVDGNPVALDQPITCMSGTFNPTCTGPQIQINIATPIDPPGLHLLQVQNPDGLLTNELPLRRQ